MQKKIKLVLLLLKYNWKSLLGFELLYKLLGGAIVVPSIYGLSQWIMKMMGYHYLTLENLKRFLKNPFTLVIFVAVVLAVCLYLMFDASALLFLAAHSYEQEKVTVLQTTRFAWRNMKRVFRKGNGKIIGGQMILFPYLSVGVIGNILATVTLPNFIKSGLRASRNWLLLGFVLLLLFGIHRLQYLFMFPYFTLEHCDYLQSKEKSRYLSRKNKWKDGMVLVWVQMLFYASYFILAAIGILLVLIIAKIFSQLHILNYVYTSAVWGLLQAIMLIVAAVGTPIGYITISVLYYLHKESNGEPVCHKKIDVQPVDAKSRKKVHMTEGLILITALCICTILIYNSATEHMNPQVEYLRTTEVTAHRGASAFYPENTMAAFEGAIEFGADWIELDVQQSKDGKIFVMHDHSFYRTTGLRDFSWNLTFDEIEQLDAGSFFSDTFAGEKIPSLEEVIELAKENHIRLNIEIKPSVNDTDIEKAVVDLIREMDFADSCVVSSQMYSCLEKVKEYDPEISTLYVMSLAYGNVNRLKAADSFSMEAGNVSPSMVSRIHNAGKQIFVWTVNNRKIINRMIDLNVDNIITDRVALVQECIYDGKTNDVIRQYVKFLREL